MCLLNRNGGANVRGMINRMAQPMVERMARQFPAVLLLGPRQCGKTTLATGFLKGSYFDLERPSDYAVFADDPELALSRLEGDLILIICWVFEQLAIFSSHPSVAQAGRDCSLNRSSRWSD